jgi:protein-tyrosine-phosphatase
MGAALAEEGAFQRDAQPKRRPQSVLFVCSENSIRSPMAEALVRNICGNGVYVVSAGLRRGPIDPFAVEVMKEAGLEISTHRPHTLDDIEDESFDLVISLSREAHERILELARGAATEVIYWPTPDPTLTEGAREQVLDAYRGVREGLATRIRTLFGSWSVGAPP